MATVGAFMGIGVVLFAVSMYFKKPLSWIVGVIPWALMATIAYGLSVTAWDIYYVAWWLGIAMVIVSILMALQTRSLDAEESDEEPAKGDGETYGEKRKQFKDSLGEISDNTRRRKRRQ